MPLLARPALGCCNAVRAARPLLIFSLSPANCGRLTHHLWTAGRAAGPRLQLQARPASGLPCSVQRTNLAAPRFVFSSFLCILCFLRVPASLRPCLLASLPPCFPASSVFLSRLRRPRQQRANFPRAILRALDFVRHGVEASMKTFAPAS